LEKTEIKDIWIVKCIGEDEIAYNYMVINTGDSQTYARIGKPLESKMTEEEKATRNNFDRFLVLMAYRNIRRRTSKKYIEKTDILCQSDSRHYLKTAKCYYTFWRSYKMDNLTPDFIKE
jgi:hypothetical protein